MGIEKNRMSWSCVGEGLSRTGWKPAAETEVTLEAQRAHLTRAVKVSISLCGNWTFGWITLLTWQCQERVVNGRDCYEAASRCCHLILQGCHSTYDSKGMMYDHWSVVMETSWEDSSWSLLGCEGPPNSLLLPIWFLNQLRKKTKEMVIEALE